MQIIGYNHILKNSNFRDNRIFKIIIGYYNLILLISVVSSLVCVCVFFFSFFCYLCFILELKTAEGWFFQRVHLCIWAIGGYELGTLSIQVHNLLTVHNNSWEATQLTFTFSNSTIETPEKKVGNIFEVNNKNTKTSSLTSFWCFYC